MFDKGKTETNEEKFFALYKDVANQLKATGISYTKGDEFYREYSEFISKLTDTFGNLQNFCQQQNTSYVRNQEESRAKAKKDADFAKDSEEFIKARTDDLIKKNKFLDELRGKMKEGLAKLDAAKIAKLKVKETPNLNNMFNTIFTIYYKEQFDWSKFKKSIVADKTEEFQSKLVNIDFATLTPENIQNLSAIKDDPGLNAFVSNDKQGGAILEIINYLEFVKEAVATQNEINDLQDKIHRIKIDAPKRGELAKIEAQRAEVLTQNIDHLNAISAKVVKNADRYADEVKRVDEMVEMYDKHKNKLHSLIGNEYPRIQQVPRNIYKDSE